MIYLIRRNKMSHFKLMIFVITELFCNNENFILPFIRAKGFYGQKAVLSKIQTYFSSSGQHPLVIYGEAGCGKTYVLCKAVKQAQEWFQK